MRMITERHRELIEKLARLLIARTQQTALMVDELIGQYVDLPILEESDIQTLLTDALASEKFLSCLGVDGLTITDIKTIIAIAMRCDDGRTIREEWHEMQ